MIKEIQLPFENIRNNLLKELKSAEKKYKNADGGDSNFHYLEGISEGLRLAIYLINKEETRLGKVD
jgi:hypothetical protein